jgi:hypothetical protein
MYAQLIAAAVTGILVATPLAAQTTEQPSLKPETNCNTTTSGTTTGNPGSTVGTSTGIEKSAILPSAGGHDHSAAPTVQSDGKPMQARPDCPPETKK